MSLTFFPSVPTADVAMNKLTKCSIDGLSVLIVRGADGVIYAFENNCSHADKPLERGVWNPQLKEIMCPFHRAIFDVANNGIVKTGPASVPLAVYPVEVRMHSGIETVFIGLSLQD